VTTNCTTLCLITNYRSIHNFLEAPLKNKFRLCPSSPRAMASVGIASTHLRGMTTDNQLYNDLSENMVVQQTLTEFGLKTMNAHSDWRTHLKMQALEHPDDQVEATSNCSDVT